MDSENTAALGRGDARAAEAPPRASSSDFLSGRVATKPGFLGLVAPSYLLSFAIFAAMIGAAGVWEVIANTRLLSVLLSGGIVALSEDDAGLGSGVPGLHYFVQSQEPVTWLLVLLSAALFMAVALLKAVQFHRIALFVGIEGTMSEHLRAYFYGHGIERMMPYRLGEVAWASALETQGRATLDQAARLVLIFKGFLLFEIFSFAFIGLIMSGLLDWAIALAPPLVILLVSWLLLRPVDRHASDGGFWGRAGEAFGDLTKDPQMLTGLAMLSLVSFALVEFATYIIPQAFSTAFTVPLVWDELRYVVVTPPVIVMAVVAGYVARLAPITPGGVGQFELAFAAVLFANGLPLTYAVVATLLVSFVRYATGLALFGFTMMVFGIETNFSRVRALFERDAADAMPARPEGA